MDLGKESLKIRMSRGSYDISSSVVQNDIRATAYMLAQRAKTCKLTSDEAKETWRWAQLALKASSDAEEKEVASIEEIGMALETKDETTNAEKSGIEPKDIVH